MKNYNKFIFTALIIILSLITITSCNGLKKTTSNNLLIELRTTACSGTCPVFSMQIYSNGLVTLDGKAFLDQIGKYESKISKSELDEIVTLFDNSNFFEFDDSYKSLSMDLPAKYITYHKNGKSKEIMAYDNIPQELTDLINRLKQLLDSLNWEKIK